MDRPEARPLDTLALTYTTKHGDELFSWRMPTGLTPEERLAFGRTAACLVILENEYNGTIADDDWREIVRRIAAKDFGGATEYWQEVCREGTYIQWDCVASAELSPDAVAAQAQGVLDGLPEQGGDGDDYYTGPEPKGDD